MITFSGNFYTMFRTITWQDMCIGYKTVNYFTTIMVGDEMVFNDFPSECLNRFPDQ